MGLAGLWLIVGCLFGFYLMMLPIVAILGITPWEFAPIYVAESFIALDPLLVMLAGHWVLYWYWYSVAMPVAMYFDHGHTLAYALLYALETFLNGIGLVVVPRCRDLVTTALSPLAILTTTLPTDIFSTGTTQTPRHRLASRVTPTDGVPLDPLLAIATPQARWANCVSGTEGP